MRRVAILVIAAACSRGGDAPRTGSAVASGASAPPAPAAPPAASPVTCTELPFAAESPVPEASGAAWLEVGGKPALFVISDSGNDGAYTIVDAESGATIEEGKLPLGGEGDDLEGVAVRGGKFYAISSPGWMRVYERADHGFTLVDGPYPLGPVDIADKKGGGMGDKPPSGDGMVCGAKYTNCGRNYEGLCLAPEPVTGPCVGFAAAKADGHLYCVVVKDNRLVVVHDISIPIARSGVMADCAFSDDGKLYAGSNLFDLGNVYRVDGWQAPATATVTRLAAIGVGFPETLAVRGDVFYRMSDTGGAPSLMKKYRCR